MIILLVLLFLFPSCKSLEFIEFKFFPFNEFYNLTNFKSLDYFSWACHGLQRLHIYGFNVQPCCECSDDCWKFGTCCIDKLWKNEKPLPIDKYIELYRNESKNYKQTECIDVIPNAEETGHEVESVYMVTTCSAISNSIDKLLCQNGSSMREKDFLPVLGNDTYLYRNEYCAKCNGITNYEYQTLDAKCVNAQLIESQRLTLSELYSQQECIFSLKKTNSFIRKCEKQNLTGNCTDLELELCRLHEGRISNGFKNYFCLKCSDKFNQSSLTETLKCPGKCDKQKKCVIPNNRDLSKYSHRFEVEIDSMKFRIKNKHQKFPIWDFLEVPSSLNLSQKEGFEQYLCSGRRIKKCCDCYRSCMREKSCCVDYLWNETNPLGLNTYKEVLMDELDKNKESDCLPVYPPAVGSRYFVTSRQMITSCSWKSSNVDRSNCLMTPVSVTPSFVVPVVGSDGNLYANSFCAKCNFVSYTYVNLTLNCQTVGFTDEDFNNTTVNGTSSINVNKTNRCNLDINKDYSLRCFKTKKLKQPPFCPINDQRHYLCKAYKGVIDGFPNYHCRSCMINSEITKSMITYCDPPEHCLYTKCSTGKKTVYPPEPGPRPRFRWSLTLSFTDNTANINFKDTRGTLESHCTSGQYFEITEGKCVTIQCPLSYKVSGLDCVLKQIQPRYHIQSLNTFSRDYVVYLQLNKFYLNEVFNLTSNFVVSNVTYKAFENIDNYTIFQSTSHVDVSVTVPLINNLKTHFQSHNFNAYIATVIHPTLITSDYGLDFSRFFHGHKLCAISEIIPVNIIQENATTFVYNNKTINTTDLTYWISYQNKRINHHYRMCKVFHLVEPCPRHHIFKNQTIKLENMTLVYNTSKSKQIKYVESEYLPVKHGYQVCLNKDNIRSVKATTDNVVKTLLDIEYYITIVGTAISIACYLCIILTYVIFKDLRTIAGMNNCFMCLSLLIADVMVLSSLKAGDDYVACFSVSIIMHWSLLAAFSWTIIIAFDLVTRFGSFIVLYSDEDNFRKLTRRSIFGFLLPASVVAIAVALDRTNTLDFGYGANSICWRINTFYPRIGFHVVPTALATLIAVAALCFTVVKISKEKRSTEKYLGGESSKYNYIVMAMKLSIILGVTEFFGYIQIPNPEAKWETNFNLAFGFTYAVLRSCRGILLWVVYIYGGAVKKRYKKQFRETMRRRRNHKDAYTMSNSSLAPITLQTDSSPSIQMKNISNGR